MALSKFAGQLLRMRTRFSYVVQTNLVLCYTHRKPTSIFFIPVRINYTPSLPFNKNHLLSHMPVGHIIKFIITYETPFWREQGLSGEVVSFDSFDVLDESDKDTSK